MSIGFTKPGQMIRYLYDRFALFIFLYRGRSRQIFIPPATFSAFSALSRGFYTLIAI